MPILSSEAEAALLDAVTKPTAIKAKMVVPLAILSRLLQHDLDHAAVVGMSIYRSL
jgi:hypothetical protein